MEETTVAGVRRHFLPWDRPLLPQAVAWLAAEWRGDCPLDLSATLVLVPTRQAGRRLREALAAHAAIRGQAVFPPRVQLPESLLERAAVGADRVASRLESQLAWAEVFRAVPLDVFRDVFPVDPPARHATWALALAREFLRLQRALAESGLRLATVVANTGADFPEADRWRQLAQLERLHDEALAARGLRDPQRTWLEAAAAPELEATFVRIVLLGLPDPLPLAMEALARLAAARPVEVVIHASPDEAAAFDAWGRPREEVWSHRVLDLPEFENRVRLCADPSAQAARLAAAVGAYAEPEGLLALGVADPEVLPELVNALAHAGREAFNPEGRKRAGDRLSQLLTALASLAAEDTFSAVEALARCPDFLDYLSVRLGEEFSAARFLSTLDDLHAGHLPATLAAARRHRPDDAALRMVADMRVVLASGDFAGATAVVLGEIFSARRYDLAAPADAKAVEAAATWMEIVRECSDAADHFASPALRRAEWWELALGLYGDSRGYDEKAEGAVELQGWLELLWEDAPHLMIAGLNDGLVPEAIAGDPFLPESLRMRLGLKTNAARFARDAYLLQAMAHCRRDHGRLDVLFGRTSSAGDSLRPSRLLLRCTDAELPARVRWLFRPAESARANAPWRRAWQLTPRSLPTPAKVAVTALRGWLACPFRFYLRHILRMEAVDPAKTELDARDFGTLCHGALEAMGREPALRDCTDEATLRDFLLTALEREAARHFGAELTLPLVVQLESARQRLARVAAVQAETRREGWVIERVEEKFLLDVGGLGLSGKIDRIDRHETTGAYRILDYKTSDRPVDPAQAHLRPPRRNERPRAFAWAGPEGEGPVWADLQLPLYLRAVAGTGNAVECGYFNLPKAVGETGIRPWTDYTRELDASAWRCAEGVAAAIRAGEFWPPDESMHEQQDDYASLFHHGVEASVAWSPREDGA